MIDQIEIHKKLLGPQWGIKGTHAGLWLNKYITEQKRDDPGSRSKLIKEVSDLPEPGEYKTYFEYWKKNLKAYSASTQTRQVRVKGRMVVGLGSESVLETSICLHHTYGLPYIPGSAIKGLAANYAHQHLSEDWQKGGKLHTIIFGSTDAAGYITFFDALYIPGTGYKGRPLYPDVITVHHQKYYQDLKEAPSDSDNPNPVPFLSATGTYLFALAAPDFQQATRWVDITFQILTEALDKIGIGAKTSSGYGRMEFLDTPMRSLNIEVKRYIRPNIPTFAVNQSITGSVIVPTDELRNRAPEAKSFLRFREFPAANVLIIVDSEEATNWTPGNTKNCLFVREEVREGCTVLVCQPGIANKKKNKNG